MNNYFILFAIGTVFHNFHVALGLSAKNPQQCFDVLDKLTQNEIEKIYIMSFQQVAATHPATDILSCFLRASHPGDKSLIEQYFDVYNKCEVYKRTNFEPFGNQQLEELVSLGLPYDLENYLRETLKSGNKKSLEQGILHVEDVMSKDIELSRDYKEYKNIIANKFKPNTVHFDYNVPGNSVQKFKQVATAKSLALRKVDSPEKFLDFLAKAVFIY